MAQLPNDIKVYFYKTISGDVSIEDFETWLYGNEQVDTVLNEGDYLALISFNYKMSGAKYELSNLLKKLIDLGDYEKYKLLELLKKTQRKDDSLPMILIKFYDLYCEGYYFLQQLGVVYGLAIELPIYNTNASLWSKYMIDQQTELLKSFSPDLDIELQKVVDWLVSGKIKLTGEKNELDRYKFIDLREKSEKE